MNFNFSQEKNEKLFQTRGVTFNNVIEAISESGVLLNFEHPNQSRYPGQKILVVNLNNYAYCVPYVIERDGTWFLKTIYPSRKFKYLVGAADE